MKMGKQEKLFEIARCHKLWDLIRDLNVEREGWFAAVSVRPGKIFNWGNTLVFFGGVIAGGQSGMSESTSWGGGYVYPLLDGHEKVIDEVLARELTLQQKIFMAVDFGILIEIVDKAEKIRVPFWHEIGTIMNKNGEKYIYDVEVDQWPSVAMVGVGYKITPQFLIDLESVLS